MSKHEQIIKIHSLLSGLALLVVVVFAIWWIQIDHIPHNFHGWMRIFDVLLFFLVTYVIWHPIVMQVVTWSIVAHIKERFHPQAAPGAKVAFVTTFVPGSEPLSLLEKTLPAMIKAKYPHDTWVLDEGNDPDVIKLCRRLGVHHFSRFEKAHFNMAYGKYARKTKGGNHNSWYEVHGNEYDFVAQLDTDFIPNENFLTATLGFFKDPKVAFVGTPQVYGNTNHSIIARGAAEQTYSFYGPVLRGLDGMDTTNLIGANHVIRVAALQAVDHYSAHITEDLLTGMKLHAAGWRSVYVPQVLAVGEGPSTWKSFFSQQRRWAYGCMHILFNHSPKLFRSMTLRRAAYYFFLQQHYFSGIATAVSIILLVAYFIFGTTASSMVFGEFLTLYAIMIIILVIMALWVQRFNVRPKTEKGMLWGAMYVNMAVWPVFFTAFVALFKRKKLIYKVTPKGQKPSKDRNLVIKNFIPHFIFAAIILLAFSFGIAKGRHDGMMIFWAIITFLIMIAIPFLEHFLELYGKTKKMTRTSYKFITRNLNSRRTL